jgi:ABC-type phosphate transport system substrate-binding protein
MRFQRIFRSFLLASLGALALGAFVAAARAEEPYQVVVNAGNPTGSLSKEKLAAYFLKKETRWGDGSKVAVVDRAPGAAVRAAFSKSVLGKDVAAVKSYWQRLLFSGKETPPAELDSDREVMDFVAKSPGGIGYVAAGTDLQPGVKALRIGS